MLLPLTFQNSRIQHFSIPSTILHYFVLQNVRVLTKLLKTCKYFYFKYKTIGLSTLSYASPEFLKLCLWMKEIKIRPPFRNIYFAPIYIFIHGNDSLTKVNFQMISNVYSANVKKLDLCLITMTYNEYNFLTSSGNIEYLRLEVVEIIDQNGNLVPVENILQKVPKVRKFKISSIGGKHFNVHYTSEAAQKMANLQRICKLKKFHLVQIPENFNIEAFCLFLDKNTENESYIGLEFINTLNATIREIFLKSLRKWLSKHPQARLTFVCNDVFYSSYYEDWSHSMKK